MSEFEGMKAITFGVFDLLHFGHFELFRRIKGLVGETGMVIVACQADDFVTKYKPVRLAYNWDTRASMIGALRYVDEVVPYTDVDVTICMLEFDMAVFGPDQSHAGFQRAKQWCLDHGRRVHILTRTEGISSSQIRTGGLG